MATGTNVLKWQEKNPERALENLRRLTGLDWVSYPPSLINEAVGKISPDNAAGLAAKSILMPAERRVRQG